MPQGLAGGAVALSVDVEEWYHNCLVPTWVRPAERPALPRELDRLIPELLELLARSACMGTFFVLGEVAADHPGRIREIAAAGHEIACHADLHLRVDDRPPSEFLAGVTAAKAALEDLIGAEISGFRAPEWSLRRLDHPLLPALVDLGFRYDSSLTPVPGSGRLANPRDVVRLEWPDGRSLLEAPPLAWGPIPANGWPTRLRSGRSIARQARRRAAAGGLALLVVHPWEISGRPSPGRTPGLGAWWVHEVGRRGFRARFSAVLEGLRTITVEAAIGASPKPEARL